MRRFFLIALLIQFALIHSAHALILVEPLVGYNFGTYRQKVFTTKSTIASNGIAYGGRLGLQWMGVQVAADYLRSTLSPENDRIENDIQMQETGLFIGYEFALFLRLYAGIMMNGTGEFMHPQDGKVKFSEPSGTKAGVSFTALPLFAINLEWRKGTFSNVVVDGTKDRFFKVKFEAFLLSLSMPVNLF